VGLLWVRDGIPTTIPYLGTPNTPGIMGFKTALMACAKPWMAIEKLRDRENAFVGALSEHLKMEYYFHVPPELPRIPGLSFGKVPGTLSICFPGIDTVDLMFKIGDRVAFSTGAACSRDKISHVLKNLGVEEADIESTIRISLGKDQPIDEIIQGAKLIATGIEELRHGS